jgi:Putative beta-barrel porin-2, OmpL-like. bbp2
VPTVAHLSRLEASSQSKLCIVHGETRDPGGLLPLANAHVSLHCLAEGGERQPDTVQKDHFDWGFRITNLYGIDYRFTTAKGYFSHQLLGKNYEYGDDLVMAYVDLYFPQVAAGMNVRLGRYISLPDIEAQLAPNNYTYSH